MQDSRIVSSAYKFRGVEHVVALEVGYDQLTVEVEEKSSADQWRATFDSSCKSCGFCYSLIFLN